MNLKENKIYSALPKLVELGVSAGKANLGLMPRSHEFGVFWQKWPEVLAEWNAEDVLNLIKGFVYYEQISPANGFGSVPPVPQIFTIYCGKKGVLTADELADWILANSINEYCPYGTNNHGAKSLAELSLIKKTISEKKLKTKESEDERERSAKHKRAQEATLRLPRSIERKDVNAIRALLAKGADPDHLMSDGRTSRDIAKSLGLLELLTNVEIQDKNL